MNNTELTKQDILDKIKQIAEKQEKNTISLKVFLKQSGISAKSFYKHFDRWNDAISLAGLTPFDKKKNLLHRDAYTKEEIILKIQGIASKLRKNYLAEREFLKVTGISYRPIHRLFGSWENAVKEAGLEIHPAHNIKIPDSELLQDYIQVTNELKHIPTFNEFRRRSKFSINVYANRFNNFTEFRKRAIRYGQENGLFVTDITSTDFDTYLTKSVQQKTHTHKILDDRPVLGNKIDFRNLMHAPVNELGVVFLFGLLSNDLNFVIEAIQPGFPDCEAQRKIKRDKWQRVHIEFEYKSSNFIEHGHDTSKCDIIVCWEHDWSDCPLEVICLKDYIKSIKK